MSTKIDIEPIRVFVYTFGMVTAKDIAERLGISAGAVKARLRRAGIVAKKYIGPVAMYSEVQARAIAAPRPNGRPRKVKK